MVKKDSIKQGEQEAKDTLSFDDFLFESGNFNHAEFLQNQGVMQLSKGEAKGLKLLDLASHLDPKNPKLFYDQGIALAGYGSEKKRKKYLLLANKKFKNATELNGEFLPAWKSWGDSLLSLGRLLGEAHFFLDAKKRYEKAISLIGGEEAENISELYWNYGKVMFELGKRSGEIFDLNRSIDAYSKASSYNEMLPAKFWQNYGEVALHLGMQVNDIHLYFKAINCHKHAVAKAISHYECWLRFAEALTEVYYLTHDEDHFCSANECFTNAAKLHPQNDLIWLSWARLLLHSGKNIKDAKRLHSAIEKCHRAYACNRKEPETLAIWAEALSDLGIITDRADLIHEGCNKIAEARELFGESPLICYATGMTLFALGLYHSELDYYYQAIEKFQEGLSINRSSHKLWFHLGYTYSIAAGLEQDPTLYERAHKFYARALSLQTTCTYYYHSAVALMKLGEFYRDKIYVEKALTAFDAAFSLQKNAVYLRPEWLHEYAMALDAMGDFTDDEKYYIKAIEILKRVLMLDPDFPHIHYHIALIYSHLSELSEDHEVYQRAISHYKIAYHEDEEHEHLIVDWALTLINLSELLPTEERELLWKEAEYKLIQAAKLGSTEAYYHLACLHSLMRNVEKALYFIEKAHHYESLPPLDELLEDEWLENLRGTELFRSYVEHLESSKRED